MPYFHPYRHLHAYIHHGRIGVLVEIGCKSEIILRIANIQTLINDVALQIAATAPEDVEALMQQPFVKDNARTMQQLLNEANATLRERFDVTKFIRWSTDDPEHPEDPTPPRTPAVIVSFRRRG